MFRQVETSGPEDDGSGGIPTFRSDGFGSDSTADRRIHRFSDTQKEG